MFESAEEKRAQAFTPAGDTLIFSVGPFGRRRLWKMSMTGDAAPSLLFPDSTDASEDEAAVSPNGQWVAYSATNGGTPNVFVQPFPPTGYRQQISATNGRFPAWTADGRQIAFVTLDNRFMLANVMPQGATLGASVPRELFTQRLIAGSSGFSIDASAERFLLLVDPTTSAVGAPGATAPQSPLTVIVNWPGAVKR